MIGSLPNGTGVEIRGLGADDGGALLEFHARLSPATLYYRYLFQHGPLTEQEVDWFTHVDQHDRVALAAVIDGDLVGVARFDREPGTASAELACVVEDRWQGEGIGSLLLDQLVARANDEGITHLTGEISVTNPRMLGLMRRLGHGYQQDCDSGVVSARVALDAVPA